MQAKSTTDNNYRKMYTTSKEAEFTHKCLLNTVDRTLRGIIKGNIVSNDQIVSVFRMRDRARKDVITDKKVQSIIKFRIAQRIVNNGGNELCPRCSFNLANLQGALAAYDTFFCPCCGQKVSRRV